MSKKEAPIIQEYNDAKCQYEYFVKGYDITESVKVLLKAHKEEYDKVKKVFDSVSGFIEAQTLYEKQLVEKDQQIAELKQQVKAKDILIDTYMSVVGTLTNAKNLLKQLEIRDKALNLAREYMFKGMCSDDVPCVEWFIKCAEEQVDG